MGCLLFGASKDIFSLLRQMGEACMSETGVQYHYENICKREYVRCVLFRTYKSDLN